MNEIHLRLAIAETLEAIGIERRDPSLERAAQRIRDRIAELLQERIEFERATAEAAANLVRNK